MNTGAPRSDLGQGFDHKRLQDTVERFKQINQARLDRTQAMLRERQQVFLRLLPLMFHIAHPRLPGFVDEDVPCGVDLFHPNEENIRAARTVAVGFQFQQRMRGQCAIESLFLMGSPGSLGHSRGSDLDIWLCYSDQVDEEGLDKLKDKCERIEDWAGTLGLEVHFFPMNARQFREGGRGDLSGEDCGSAQHKLLLDEFYRTSVLVAGRIPLWWLVPPQRENEYEDFVARLFENQFITEQQVVDFGGVGNIPAGEFVGAGLWQLYKGIGSPYKSVLKLMVTQFYAEQFPKTFSLSLHFKDAVFNEVKDPDLLDPYTLMYQQLERYLNERDELDRLELARRCLYFKANLPISKGVKKANRIWRHDLLEKMLLNWGWDEIKVSKLDQRSDWDVWQVMEERRGLVTELVNSYRFLSHFNKENKVESLLNKRDLTVLGHKLYAAFDRKPGKIELINPGISKDIGEEKLSIHLLRQFVPDPKSEKPKKEYYWALHPGVVRPADEKTPIKKSKSLIEVLSWAYFNQVLDGATHLALYKGRQGPADYEQQEILSALKALPLPEKLPEADFTRTSFPKRIELFINVGVDPLGHLTRKGIQKISNRTDSLGYSALKENLVVSIDQITFNSWNEIIVTRYHGKQALIRCIEDYLVMLPPSKNSGLPVIDAHCFCITRPIAIKERVLGLLHSLHQTFYQNRYPNGCRFVVQIAHLYFVIQFEQDLPLVDSCENLPELIALLANPQPQYSPIILEPLGFKDSPISLVLEDPQPGKLKVCYFVMKNQAQVYIVDEHGSLFYYVTHFHSEISLLNPLNHFLLQVSERKRLHSSVKMDDMGDFLGEEHLISYFQIIPAEAYSPIHLEPKSPSSILKGKRYFSVQGLVDYDENRELSYSVLCGDKDFSSLEWGESLFEAVVNYLLDQRTDREPYPIYLTDLEITDRVLAAQGQQSLQTVRYLKYKYILERKLNAALAMITTDQNQPNK